VYLCGDAARERSSAHLVDGFRRRALGGVVRAATRRSRRGAATSAPVGPIA